MITVHSYCSYKHSPSGFVYGSFRFEESAAADSYRLSNDNNIPVVRSAFENGIIRKVCGKIPGSSKYVFLVRKLKHGYGNAHDDIGREVQMNFAFEFDSFDEFHSFASGYLNAEKQDAAVLYKKLADCIIPDKSIENYNYRIPMAAFNSWIKSIKQHSTAGQELNDCKESICITTSSKSMDYTEEIKKIFNFPPAVNGQSVELCRIADTSDYRYPCKKKQFCRNPRMLTIGAVGLLILLVMLVMVLTLFGISGRHTKGTDKKPVNAKNTSEIVMNKTLI